MFAYKIITLSPGEIDGRRRELDRAGYQAYLIPIVLLSLIVVLRRLQWSIGTTSQKPSVVGKFRQRLVQLSNTTLIPEFGPLKVQIIGITYAGYLLWRIVHNTGEDYMHVTKAFGHVAVSQLPLHYLLSVKWRNSPITLATGLSHQRLNAYHKLFGRIIHALLATHAILYLAFFIKMNALPKRIKDADVQLGIAAFWSVNFLGILALPMVRRKAYKLFYQSHVILSMLLLVVLWFHVKHTRIYVAQAAIFWLANSVSRREQVKLRRSKSKK